MEKKIQINQKATSKNDVIAAENREFFNSRNILAINIISSPGSGKTALLERLGSYFKQKLAVITGDIQTTLDADRINKSGAKAVQIETGGDCHLTAAMIRNTLPSIDFSTVELMVIENVGNLV